MEKEAKFWKSLSNRKVQCSLCSHNCKIDSEKVGICGVRKNKNGRLFSLIYGSCSSIA
jgi:pyruvate formate lyase activating enzyme